MTNKLDVFCEIPCLTERSTVLAGLALQKKWFRGADKRILGQYLQKFISYNDEMLTFLGVKPFIVGTDQSSSIFFRTSSFIGTVPLRSPDTGKQIGDFVVSPRFLGRDRFEEYTEILDLLGSNISPEFTDSLPLASARIFRPPLYLEALKFIASLEELLKKPWRKFDNSELTSQEPTGQINWNKYSRNEFRVENRLLFPVRRNILSEFHSDYAEIRYVFDICNRELMSTTTPRRIRALVGQRLSYLESKLYRHNPKETRLIKIRAADRQAVRMCKQKANIILNRELVDGTAWRVDFNDVFEKFVQHIFSEVAKSVGGRLFPNFRIPSRTRRRYSWELRHIEPDGVFQRENLSVFIDAKYKSNLYNKYDDSDLLKDDYRRDLHQVLAYSSFDNSHRKTALICYPSNEIEIKSAVFENRLNDATTNVLLAGIPLMRSAIPDAVQRFSQTLLSIDQSRKAS